MARAGNLHSRVVSWLKVILPLSALAILSLLFLVARTINPDDAIPYAQVDVEDRIREPRVTAAAYAGVTSDGAALTIDAAEARPASEANGPARARDVTGRLETPGGGSTDLVAAEMQMDDAGQRMLLSGGVVLTTSTGYRVTAPEVTTALTRTEIESGGGEVTADGPLGDLRADSMRISGVDGAYQMVFNGGVRLIYQPPN